MDKSAIQQHASLNNHAWDPPSPISIISELIFNESEEKILCFGNYELTQRNLQVQSIPLYVQTHAVHRMPVVILEHAPLTLGYVDQTTNKIIVLFTWTKESTKKALESTNGALALYTLEFVFEKLNWPHTVNVKMHW